jgi:hypothetical protein
VIQRGLGTALVVAQAILAAGLLSRFWGYPSSAADACASSRHISSSGGRVEGGRIESLLLSNGSKRNGRRRYRRLWKEPALIGPRLSQAAALLH